MGCVKGCAMMSFTGLLRERPMESPLMVESMEWEPEKQLQSAENEFGGSYGLEMERERCEWRNKNSETVSSSPSNALHFQGRQPSRGFAAPSPGKQGLGEVGCVKAPRVRVEFDVGNASFLPAGVLRAPFKPTRKPFQKHVGNYQKRQPFAQSQKDEIELWESLRLLPSEFYDTETVWGLRQGAD